MYAAAMRRALVGLLTMLLVVGCGTTDTTDLEARLDDAEARIADLEAAVASSTTTIASTSTTAATGVFAPPVIGEPLDTAVAALEDAGLEWIVTERDVTADAAHGTVLDQLPGGQVPAGSVIGLIGAVDPAVRARAQVSREQAAIAADLVEQVEAANALWEEGGAGYSATSAAFSQAAGELDVMVAAVGDAVPPDEFEDAWTRRLDALRALATLADDVVLGLAASDDGTARRDAVAALVAAQAAHLEATETFAAAAYLDELVEGEPDGEG